jgi:hypothetical protein
MCGMWCGQPSQWLVGELEHVLIHSSSRSRPGWIMMPFTVSGGWCERFEPGCAVAPGSSMTRITGTQSRPQISQFDITTPPSGSRRGNPSSVIRRSVQWTRYPFATSRR